MECVLSTLQDVGRHHSRENVSRAVHSLTSILCFSLRDLYTAKRCGPIVRQNNTDLIPNPKSVACDIAMFFLKIVCACFKFKNRQNHTRNVQIYLNAKSRQYM